MTCGNETDPRIQLEVDVADALTLVFMSDSSGEGRGVNLTVFEINGTAATVRMVWLSTMILLICRNTTQDLHEKKDQKFLLLQDQMVC